jgi:hypothetical protein
MTEYTQEEKDDVWRDAKLKYKNVLEQREEIMTAFAAKYNCEPDEMVQVEQRPDASTMLWFVVRKQDCIYCSRCKDEIAKGEPRILEKE